MSTRTCGLIAGRVASIAVSALAIIAAAPSRALAQDRCDPSAGTIYAPGQAASGLVLFEDLWNRNGDLDFNDQTIAYNYEFLLDSSGNVVTMKATINVLAVGAGLHNGAYLHLPLLRASTPVTVVDQGGNSIAPIATETDLVIPLVDDTRSLFATQYPFINTDPSLPVESATPLAFTIAFTNGAPLDTSASPFDLFIARNNDFTYQIHLPQYAGTDAMNTSLFGQGDDRSNQDLSAHGGVDNTGRWFVNENGLPIALALPQVILWPQERVAIESDYADLTGFASSGGTQDLGWYTDAPNVNTGLAFTYDVNGQPPPTPAQSVGPALYCGSDVAAGLSGLLWELPCGYVNYPGVSCVTVPSVTVTSTMGGEIGSVYDVALRFRGVVEQKTYSQTCGAGLWGAGGSYDDDGYNVYQLTISSPPQSYVLNVGTTGIWRSWPLDVTQTLRIAGGATVTLYGNSEDNYEIANTDALYTGNPISIDGVIPPQPYNGQFIQMDVLSVALDPTVYAAGGSGDALHFNGSQAVTIPDAPSLHPADLTFETWLRFDAASGSLNSIAGKPYGNQGAGSFGLWFENGELNASVYDTSEPDSVAWAPDPTTWHHAALTFDSTTNLQTLYLDGAQAACTTIDTAPILYDSQDLIIGGGVGSPQGYWNGELDEVRLFSTVRTPDQVWADLHAHTLGPAAGLVGEWTFDTGSGAAITDSSGAGNDGTLGVSSVANSSPTWVSSDAP